MKFEYFYYKNFFSDSECNEISHVLKTSISDGEDAPAENVSKTSEVNVVNWSDVRHLLWRMEDSAKYINQKVFGFDLYDLTHQDYVNHNVYKASNAGKYNWHKDAVINEIYDLKVTVIANISPLSYQGGEFELFLNGPRAITELSERGSVLIFPSYTYHRVTSVTQGERESVSIWLNGPNFR